MVDFPTELSRLDVIRLQADKTPETRIETATKVAAQFSAAMLGDNERRIAETILRGLMKDAEVRVREALAAQLKVSLDLPRDMAVTLAQDVESVSLPILQYCEVLSDEDLIKIVRSGSPDKQVAIAGRRTVSARVAVVLIDTENEAAVARMVAIRAPRLTSNCSDGPLPNTVIPKTCAVPLPSDRNSRQPSRNG